LGVYSITAAPLLPARPVRPERWIYVSASWGAALARTRSGHEGARARTDERTVRGSTWHHTTSPAVHRRGHGPFRIRLINRGEEGAIALATPHPRAERADGCIGRHSHLWRLRLYHQVNAGDVQTSRRHIRGNQHIELGVAEGGEGGLARCLRSGCCALSRKLFVGVKDSWASWSRRCTAKDRSESFKSGQPSLSSRPPRPHNGDRGRK
jgi:hypothetical protein